MSNSGGGVKDVGDVTGTMAFRQFDQKTRPFERTDVTTYVSQNWGNLPSYEDALIKKLMLQAAVALPLSFAAGVYFTRSMNWKQISKSLGVGVNTCKFVGQLSGGLCGVSIPFVVIQQGFIAEVNELPQESELGFQLRRMMISQRGAVMFSHGNMREVSREEQEARSAADVTVKRGQSNMLSGSDINVNAELTKQQLLPVAQSGYKPMDK